MVEVVIGLLIALLVPSVVFFLYSYDRNTCRKLLGDAFVVVHDGTDDMFWGYNDTWFFRVFGVKFCRPITDSEATSEAICILKMKNKIRQMQNEEQQRNAPKEVIRSYKYDSHTKHLVVKGGSLSSYRGEDD